MIHAWEEDMCTMYGSGLLMWHCFCDQKGHPEPERAPATQPLLSIFVTHMAAAYSGKTISNYLNGVQAWHILHSIPWLTPNTSKQKKHAPYTPNFIAVVRQHLDLEVPIDVAIYTCLTTCFYASPRLGEFTICTISSFHPSSHVTTWNLSYDQDHNGHKVTILHLPSTNAASIKGEDVYWATQSGDTNPMAALQNHLHINQPSEASHLFAYQVQNAHPALTKAKFLERIARAACVASFIIAPYIQSAPIIHENFIHYTMLPVC
ncbi:hypothetical protein EDB86DRAFT_3066125 [Lactarius hatsudake]|nr:hypothetical protein EDB86DRAFT_3066125 [Lactarius hatsudake]